MNRRLFRNGFLCVVGFGLFYAVLMAWIASFKPHWIHWLNFELLQDNRVGKGNQLNGIQQVRRQVSLI